MLIAESAWVQIVDSLLRGLMVAGILHNMSEKFHVDSGK